jgi:hypothetical protein
VRCLSADRQKSPDYFGANPLNISDPTRMFDLIPDIWNFHGSQLGEWPPYVDSRTPASAFPAVPPMIERTICALPSPKPNVSGHRCNVLECSWVPSRQALSRAKRLACGTSRADQSPIAKLSHGASAAPLMRGADGSRVPVAHRAHGGSARRNEPVTLSSDGCRDCVLYHRVRQLNLWIR